MRIVQQSPADLVEYASIPASFRVTHQIDPDSIDVGNAVTTFRVIPVGVPYIKDYDTIDGCHPEQWPERFDMSKWWMTAIFVERRRVGGAIIAVDTSGLQLLHDSSDSAILWDLRVHLDYRQQGIGSILLRAGCKWARKKQHRRLEIETQNNNVAACHLYARHGCVLAQINRSAYPNLPGETQLIWYKDLAKADE